MCCRQLQCFFFPRENQKCPWKPFLALFEFFSRTDFFFSRTLFHAQLGFFTDTFCDFFTGMIFIFTDVKVGFFYSFDGVNQKKFSRTPTIFSRTWCRENFHGHFLHFTGTFQDFFTGISDFHGQKPENFHGGKFDFHGEKKTLPVVNLFGNS